MRKQKVNTEFLKTCTFFQILTNNYLEKSIWNDQIAMNHGRQFSDEYLDTYYRMQGTNKETEYTLYWVYIFVLTQTQKNIKDFPG